VPLGGALLLLLVHLAVSPFVAFVLLTPVVSLLAGDDPAPLQRGATVGAVSIVGGLLTLGALALFASHWSEPRRTLALVSGRLPWWVAPPLVLALAITIDLLTALAGQPVVPQQFLPLFGDGLDTVLMVAVLVLVAPPVEELVYRGALYGGFAARWGARAAFTLTTAVFAAVHLATYGLDLFALGQVLLLGGLLTWLRAASGSLIPALVGHLVANAYATALLLLLR
jgi:membrane protease YdiL (CAAX protease family)